MKVSLVVTVRDEEDHIAPFLESVFAQSRPPDEIVIVDGGSTDRTAERIQPFLGRGIPARFFIERGANIPRGRNQGVRAASHDIIAMSDAGCLCEPRWLEELTRPFAGPDLPDVVAGGYTPVPQGAFERLTVLYLMPDVDRVARILPSGRSVAFRRGVWEAVGGYPEVLDHAEDTAFALRVRKEGYRIAFAPGARVRWRPRSTWRGFFLQYLRYARGDGRSGHWPAHYARKGAIYAGGLALVAAGWWHPRAVALAALGGIAYIAVQALRVLRRSPEWRLLTYLPPLVLMHDVAQVAGYVWGSWERLRGGFRGQQPAPGGLTDARRPGHL